MNFKTYIEETRRLFEMGNKFVQLGEKHKGRIKKNEQYSVTYFSREIAKEMVRAQNKYIDSLPWYQKIFRKKKVTKKQALNTRNVIRDKICEMIEKDL